MTLTELSRRSGVPRGTCSTWEYEGVPAQVAHACAIARALGVGVEELFRA